jgi:uncharacterized protein
LAPPYLREVDGEVELTVRVTPRASKSRVAGLHADSLKVQLAAPPVDGAANDALLELLAEVCGLPKRAVRLVSGATSRQKRVRLAGLDAAAIEAVMKKWL